MFIRNLMIVLFSAQVIISCFGCSRKTDDERVRNVVSAVRKAAEERDVKGVLTHLEKDYRDPQGNDYQAIKGILLYYFFQHQAITIIITNLDVSVEGSSATARFQAVLSGRNNASGGILPEALGAYRFDVSFRKEQDDWKIQSARWERWGDRESEPGSSP